MRFGALFVATLAAAGAAPLVGQANADKARLDEFAAPRPEKNVAIDQVSNPPSTRNQPVSSTPSQVASSGDHREASQIGNQQQRSAAAPAALSNRSDGRPGGLVTLGGTDRCDPQLPGAEALATCRRVIERRADEFGRTRPAPLSPEAALLFPERTSTSLAQDSQSDRKARSTMQDSDPSDRVNQELAAITNTPPPPPASQIPTDGGDKTLSQIIGQLVVQLQSGTP